MTNELTLRPNIELFIADKENLNVLEDRLDITSQEYLGLKKQKENLDFGQALSPDILVNLLPEVTRETEEFLGVSDVPETSFSIFYLPDAIKHSIYTALGVFGVVTAINLLDGLQISDLEFAWPVGLCFGASKLLYDFREHLGSLFDPSEKIIRLGEKTDVVVVSGISHEYTHHIQDARTKLIRGKNPIAEGHARGVERAVCKSFADRTGNPVYLFRTMRRTAIELKDAYVFACNKKGTTPKDSLLNSDISKFGLLARLFGRHYSLGVAAMCIAETKHGDKVYRDVVNNDYSFLRVAACR